MDEKLAKAIPTKIIEKAYDDIISPSGKQVGRLSEDLVKVMRLMVAPIQLLAS